MRAKLKNLGLLLWLTLRRYIREDALNHGAALAYYTVFAMPAILMILISLVGYFWGTKDIEQYFFVEMNRMFGEEGARQVKFMLDKVEQDGSNKATITGIVLLLFSSTVVFYTIQHSLNRLWEIHHDIRHGFIKYVRDKFLSLAFILSFGFLLMISLVLQATVAWMNRFFSSYVDSAVEEIGNDPTLWEKALEMLHGLYTEYFSFGFFALEFIIVLSINAFLFACIFKFLPDAKVKWKVVLPGGLLTAILFEAGQSLISWKLGHTDFSNSFGPAGALVMVFVWIFYSSQVVYYGGIFVDLYARKIGHPIEAIPGHAGNHH